jgi:hypothetical protein
MKPTFSLLMVSLLLLSTAIVAVAPVQADAPTPAEGIIQVTVKDASGNFIPDAPIYISAGRHLQLRQSERNGVIRFNVPEGDYKLSSAISHKTPESIERYASLEAPVHVVPGDTVSVFLTLYPLSASNAPLSVSTLRKMGIDSQAAENSNN